MKEIYEYTTLNPGLFVVPLPLQLHSYLLRMTLLEGFNANSWVFHFYFAEQSTSCLENVLIKYIPSRVLSIKKIYNHDPGI